MLRLPRHPRPGIDKPDDNTPRAAFTPPLAVFLVGLAISVGLFAVVMRHAQNEELERAYRAEAAPLAVVLGRSIDQSLGFLSSVSALLAASNAVERGAFRAFVERALKKNDEIQALEWIPRVRAEERAAYETAARRDELVDFRITEKDSSGVTVPAAARPEYFPVYFLEPLEGNEAALGFDLASNPERREALDRARDTGKIVATQRITLVQETARQYGFLAFAPIYSTGSVPETVEARRESLTGFALGIFRIDDILQTVLEETRAPTNLDLYVIDADAPADEALLHYRGAGKQDRSLLSEDELLLGGYEKITLSVADRNWLLIFTPPTEFSFPASSTPWMVGGAGLLLTIFFVVFLRTTQNRTRVIGRMVVERTAELSNVNQALTDEMAERRTAERLLQEQNTALQLIQKLTLSGDTAGTADDVLLTCLREICEFTGWPIGHAHLPDEDIPDEFTSAEIWHSQSQANLKNFFDVTEITNFTLPEEIITGILADQKPRWISDINQDNRYTNATTESGLPFTGAFFLPLLADHRVVAILEFYAPHVIEPDEKSLTVMSQISIMFGHAVERAQAAKKLLEREEFVRLITDNMPVVIAYFDADMTTRFYNQLGLDWFACTREDLIGKPIDGIIPELDVAAYQATVQKTLAGETQTFDATHTYPDGKMRNVTISYIPHFDRAGDAIGYFCTVQDNTHRLEIERHLNQAQKMDAIGQLTGGIAHDFNNILMVTDGYTRRALKDADDPDAVKEALEEVLSGTDRAAKLTKQLLAFSRRQIMEKRVFRVEEEISDIEALLRQSTGERYEIKFESFTEGTCVETDPSEFSQALVNLVINARDAMPQGGQIVISTRDIEITEEFAQPHRNLFPGKFVEVSVHDHGTGIDKDTLEHIFEPFFTTKDQGKGTGLGLAMVYGFAQTSGGTVDVSSVEGQGTIFRIYLPAVDRDPQVIVAEVEQDHFGRGETILLTEDDPALLEIVREMLDTLGYNVLTACDGFDALEVEAEHDGEIALLLSDVVMPNMGGFEAAEMIREARPDIKIVFMSGYPNRAGISNENLPDNCQFLQKPVKPGHLARTIRNELDTPLPSNTDDQDTVKTYDYA
ncbi:MAG: PAS domain-containing protein [Alphaproteobacteria bacterium]|nr:PAS domain-containing protein [Alphaproteobacteria bacterium]